MTQPEHLTHACDSKEGTRGRAFSLAELILVLVIMAILSAIAVPRFAAAARNSAVDLAARRLAADLRFTQAEAIKTQSRKSVTFSTSTNSYVLVSMLDPDNDSRTYRVNLGDPPYEGICILSADFGGTSILTFDRFGGPSAPGTVVVGRGQHTRTVRVASGAGRITVE
ncbi:MAG TPA: GspH/FimT family pseudopilin [Phycisphaerae bacterium]|nr:GspH/FimT family pseudopilin [Phycisphaerae bacterium]